jgi:hypothetical protein
MRLLSMTLFAAMNISLPDCEETKKTGPVDAGGPGPAHIPVSGAPKTAGTYRTRACTTSDNCTDVPPCTRFAEAYCFCEGSNVSTATGTCRSQQGTCIWQVDPTKGKCVCVPGKKEVCPSGSGTRTCNNDGTQWGGGC